MDGKRGLSTVATTYVTVAVTIVAALFIWTFLNPVISDNSQNIGERVPGFLI
jgi:FlaG/FlaF family flagellin (archaellin)